MIELIKDHPFRSTGGDWQFIDDNRCHHVPKVTGWPCGQPRAAHAEAQAGAAKEDWRIEPLDGAAEACNFEAVAPAPQDAEPSTPECDDPGFAPGQCRYLPARYEFSHYACRKPRDHAGPHAFYVRPFTLEDSTEPPAPRAARGGRHDFRSFRTWVLYWLPLLHAWLVSGKAWKAMTAPLIDHPFVPCDCPFEEVECGCKVCGLPPERHVAPAVREEPETLSACGHPMRFAYATLSNPPVACLQCEHDKSCGRCRDFLKRAEAAEKALAEEREKNAPEYWEQHAHKARAEGFRAGVEAAAQAAEQHGHHINCNFAAIIRALQPEEPQS